MQEGQFFQMPTMASQVDAYALASVKTEAANFGHFPHFAFHPSSGTLAAPPAAPTQGFVGGTLQVPAETFGFPQPEVLTATSVPVSAPQGVVGGSHAPPQSTMAPIVQDTPRQTIASQPENDSQDTHMSIDGHAPEIGTVANAFLPTTGLAAAHVPIREGLEEPVQAESGASPGSLLITLPSDRRVHANRVPVEGSATIAPDLARLSLQETVGSPLSTMSTKTSTLGLTGVSGTAFSRAERASLGHTDRVVAAVEGLNGAGVMSSPEKGVRYPALTLEIAPSAAVTTT